MGVATSPGAWLRNVVARRSGSFWLQMKVEEGGTVMKMVVLPWMREGAGLFRREWRLSRLT